MQFPDAVMRDEGPSLMTTLAHVESAEGDRRFRARFWRVALGGLGLFWIAVLLAVIN